MANDAHTCTKHAPGTYACYHGHHCRCQPCKDSNAARMRRYQWRMDNGLGTLLVDAEPLRARLLQLDMTPAEIARQAGVSQETVSGVLTLRRPRVLPVTAAKLAAVQPTTSTKGLVDAAGTVRRLRALHCNGWGYQALGDYLGRRRNATCRLMGATSVHVTTHTTVAALYESLWGVQAPEGISATKARNRAARNGWAPPMAWDDGHGPHGIDNPAATPYGRRDRDPRNTPVAVVVAELEHLLEAGESLGEIARHLGLRMDSIQATARRAGRDDLIRRLSRRAA